MAVVNLKKRQIECKIVYYGAARCGKTTNLDYIHRTFTQKVKSEMISINTDGDRTLFFDFMALEVGKLKGCDVRVQLYTVPGQVKYSSTRKLVLRGADGIVFVADSLDVRREQNMLALKDLQQNLRGYNLNIFKVPLVMQFNKRDLDHSGVSLMSVDQMANELNRQLKVPAFPAAALNGMGVAKTLKECLRLVLRTLQQELKF
jgi:signal recognition particle receptor subunit beta